jgi:glutathione S-transferase
LFRWLVKMIAPGQAVRRRPGYSRAVITLYQTPPAWGLPNLSPFCLKLETYLRMTERPYQVAQASPRKAPKGKVPYIADGDMLLGDSGLIIDYLVRTYGDKLDAGLDPEDRARGLLLRRTLEDSVYYTVLQLRWSSSVAWPHMVEALAPILPPLLNGQIAKLIRRQVLKECRAQGSGRHSRQELLSMLDQDFSALATLLGDSPYFLGSAPRSADATAYGFLAQIHGVPWQSEERDLFGRHANLIAYVERMKERFWSGWSPPPSGRSSS